MNKFVSEILKRTISGKPYMEEALKMEGYLNQNIQEKYKLTPKTLAVDYADMLLPLKKYAG